jgi:hypothetical protein
MIMAENKRNNSSLTSQDIEKINAQFRKEAEEIKKSDERVEVKEPSIFAKAKTYAEAMVSKGISKKECSGHTKILRIFSCHGDNTDSLPPCSERMVSEKFADSFYCGKCGCGDKKGTQLVNMTIKGESQYSKLDYPKVSCPLKMPGFTDYVPSEEGISENYRKKEIEKRHGVEYIRQHSNP